MLHAWHWHGPSVAVDLGLESGAYVRGAEPWRVLHVPGHTPGHLMLWNAARRITLIGDALNGATQIDRHGRWTAPPSYTDRDLYLMSIQTIEALEPKIVLTGHYPVMRDAKIATFLAAKYELESSYTTLTPGRACPTGALACTNLAAST